MNVVVLRPVADFVDSLDAGTRAEILHLIHLLERYGHALSMPHAKPIGRGLWELRHTGRPQIRIVYGFCKPNIVLLLALKKQRPSLRTHDIALARKRFDAYCGS